MARHIDKLTVDKIMQATKITDVIGDFLDLRKRGVEYQCLCPFHDDRTVGSFSINPNKGMYKCFACGAGGDAVKFLMEYKGSKLTYPDALRYLAKKYSIIIPDDDDDQSRWQHVKPSQPKAIQEVHKDMLVIPRDIVLQTMKANHLNIFVEWLIKLEWSNRSDNNQRERLKKTLWQYCVGKWRDGRVVFWQIDMQGRPRGGKLMRYKEDGHRDKSQNPGWIYNQDGIRQTLDLEHHEYRSTLFGAHLIPKYPNATINIVESEKTAIIMANAEGMPDKSLWVACGGIKFLNPEWVLWLLQHKRNVMLWPDKDGEQEWKDKIKHIPNAVEHITTSFIERNWIEEDGPKADVADIMLRHMIHRETYIDRGIQTTGRHVPAYHPISKNLLNEINAEPFIDPEELNDRWLRWARQRMRDSHQPKTPIMPDTQLQSADDVIKENPELKQLLK